VLDGLVAVKAAGGLYGHVLFMHQLLVFRLLELLGSVVAGETVLLLGATGAQNQGGFELTPVKKSLIGGPTRGLDEIKVAAATGDLGLVEHLVGDGLVARGLNRLFRQFMTETALASTLVELDVGKVAKMA
jgi:hypothetical protein